MRITSIFSPVDLEIAQAIAKSAFATTTDSDLSDWLSFTEMQKAINEKRGLCLLASSDSNEPAGILYAQQENPINGREGLEKWVRRCRLDSRLSVWEG